MIIDYKIRKINDNEKNSRYIGDVIVNQDYFKSLGLDDDITIFCPTPYILDIGIDMKYNYDKVIQELNKLSNIGIDILRNTHFDIDNFSKIILICNEALIEFDKSIEMYNEDY